MNEENSIKGSNIPSKKEVIRAIGSFSCKEKKALLILAGLFVVSFLWFVQSVNQEFKVNVPAHGGTLTEGIIGTPRLINPVLAISDADRDITELVYSGLIRKMPDGEIVPDLASSYEISNDGLSYTFTLKDDLTFHDGKPLTTDDVLFTIEKAQDQVLKSPKRLNWEGVTVQKIDDKKIRFILKQPYSPFIENATIGILPKHIWKNISSEQMSLSDFNTNGVGSGPYKIESIKKDSSGIPSYYKLNSFKKFALGKPYIDTIVVRFYANEKELVQALKNGAVDNINAIDPEYAKDISKDFQIITTPLPRIFGVFFNQNQSPALSDIAVRRALNNTVNRKEIIDSVLYGYGIPAYSPIPKTGKDYVPVYQSSEATDQDKKITEARASLEKAGWKWNEEKKVLEKKDKKNTVALSFSITTADTPELKAAAMLIENQWEKLGANVEIRIFESGDLNQNIIRPRKYDALLFGEIIRQNSDPYAFWHSSQRNDPGLNIAMYANSSVDKLLETARTTTDEKKRQESYRLFENEISSDVPAIFLYSPDFIYVLGKKLKGVDFGETTITSERFTVVYKWYLKTENVWKIFTKEENII
ncbi:MAG: Extracellular solute-binding protein family 5 [Parcubacteria group bacterium LiPW_30]|nr:MAG: Extracellular solute-binding protein family 5 [Parcubacteria group bacterium LiPW_30]